MSIHQVWLKGGAPLGTRAQWANGRLRSAILSGELRPGERIRPVDLAAQWNVSPTPLREALFRLEADGLVESIPHRGTRVTPLLRSAVSQLYELRVLLEPLALRKAMAARDQVDESRVRAAHAALVSTHGTGDLFLGEQVHRDFHRALFEACGSPWLLSLTDMMSEHSSRYRLLSLEPRGGWEYVHEEHLALLEAFLVGNVDDAVALLTAHINRTLDCILLLPELRD